jgi:hypothetical protein
MHGGSFAGLLCLGTLLVQGDLAAQVATDVNIATGLDISASVGRDEEWLERFGTASGLASQTFTEAVLLGRHGRAGVAVFAWSSQGCPLLVAWTVISTMEVAVRIAHKLEATPLIDFEHDLGPRHHAQSIDIGPDHHEQSIGPDRMTDLSRAIEWVLSAFGASGASVRVMLTISCIRRRRSGPAAQLRAERGSSADGRAKLSG